jgi:hypothetical protein
MKIEGRVLTKVTKKDIVNGTFIIPPFVNEIEAWAFADCISLKEIVIPDSVVLIRSWAFWDCTSLQSITITNPNIELGYNTLKGCHRLTNIIAPEHIKKEIEWQVTLARFAQPNEVTAKKFQELRTKLQE